MKTGTRAAASSAAALCFVLVSSICAFAQTYAAAGKTVAFKSVANTTFGVSPYTIDLEKGKKKYLLSVDVTLSALAGPSGGFGGGVCITGATVNGVTMYPFGTPGYYCHDCDDDDFDSGTDSCTVHGTYWLDVDQAEQSFPGTLVNQPLNFIVTSFGNGFGTANLAARMQKK